MYLVKYSKIIFKHLFKLWNYENSKNVRIMYGGIRFEYSS